jgi:ankyrin repeat protein
VTWNRFDALVELLINKGANVNAQGGKYGTALQSASAQGSKAMIELLPDTEADVNAQGGKHGTALQAALRAHHAESKMQLLLERGADLNYKCSEHGTALDAALREHDEDVIGLLLERGAYSSVQSGCRD